MTHKPNISKNERSAASNRWRHAANIKHGLAIIAFVACILPASNLCGQNIAIKSNLLYDLTTTLNMGGEVRCDDTHTISLSLNYNPWNFGGNKKMKHFLLQPEYRKWFNEVFTGSFIGFQLHYALFNFGGMLPWGFNNQLKSLSRELNLKSPVSSYTIRHSWATNAKYQGIPIEMISESLGHKSIKTTQTYLKGFGLKKRTEANQLNCFYVESYNTSHQ